MSMTAELADGRKLEFPDGTDPAVIQATVKKLVKPDPPTARVALQSAAKGAAAIPDMFLGLPAQAFNLGSAGIGYAAGELGRPDITANMPIAGPALTQPVRSGLEAVGAISPEFEPQTAGQRVLGRALEAAPSFAMSPTSGLKELGGKLAVGALSGGAGQATEELTGSKLAGAAVSMLTPAAVGAVRTGGASILEPVRGKTLKDAAAAGYVVPPSLVKPTVGTGALEKVAGKASLSQEASVRNQTVTNNLAAKAVGLPEGTPLTPEALQGVRKQAGVIYDAVDDLKPPPTMTWFPRFHETKLGTQLQKARADANELWLSNKRTPHPSTREAAQKLDQLAESIEGDIARIAKASGQPELVKQLQDTRKLFAKTYDVERALIPNTGDVSASAIGNLLKKKPLTGELKTIGGFAKAFPRESRNAVTVPSPSVSGTDAMASALLGTAGYGAAGGPAGMVAGALPLLRSPARSLALSAPVQNRLIREPQPLGTKGLEALLGGRAMIAPQ